MNELTLSCRDRRGIVALVSRFLAERGLTIRDSQQFGDEETGLFFMRVHAAGQHDLELERLQAGFNREVSTPLQAEARLHDADRQHRMLSSSLGRDTASTTCCIECERG